MGRGENCTFPGTGSFLIEEQSPGQFGSVSALHLSVASSQGQRISEPEQLFLLISVFLGEILEGEEARDGISCSAPWNQGSPSN